MKDDLLSLVEGERASCCPAASLGGLGRNFLFIRTVPSCLSFLSVRILDRRGNILQTFLDPSPLSYSDSLLVFLLHLVFVYLSLPPQRCSKVGAVIPILQMGKQRLKDWLALCHTAVKGWIWAGTGDLISKPPPPWCCHFPHLAPLQLFTFLI